MATRRPNKPASERPARKPTVAGRKRPVTTPGKADEPNQVVGQAEASQPVEQTEPPQPAEQTELPQQTEQTEAPQPAEQTEPAEPPQLVERAERVETNDAPKTSLVKPDDDDDFVPVDAAPAVPAADTDKADTEKTDSEKTVADESEDTDETAETPSPTTEADTVKPSGKSARRPVSRVSTIKAGGSAAASTATAAASTDKPGRFQSVGTGVRNARSSVSSLSFVNWRTTRLVAIVAVALGIIAAILAWTPGAKIGDNKAFVDAPTTTDVLAQARNKVCAPFAYEVNGYDKWAQNARVALTGQALDEFNKNIEAQKQIVQQSNSSVDCRLDTVGVQTLSGDHAVLIASLVLSRSISGSVLDSQTARVQANMVKKGDSWLMERLYTL